LRRDGDKCCTLIAMYPQHSQAIYLDSGSATPKDYDTVKLVLDKALNSFAKVAGPLKVENKFRGCLKCTHTTKFPCLKQSASEMEAWYAILHMREFLKDQHALLLPASLRKPYTDLANGSAAQIRAAFRSIQRDIARIIHEEVTRKGGLFYNTGIPPKNAEIEGRLAAAYENRPFNSLEGVLPFPPKM